MTSRDFCYWLQGYFEIAGKAVITAEQAQCIAAHLSLVFKHEIDPSMGDAAHQAVLDAVHETANPKPARPPFNDPNPKLRC